MGPSIAMSTIILACGRISFIIPMRHFPIGHLIPTGTLRDWPHIGKMWVRANPAMIAALGDPIKLVESKPTSVFAYGSYVDETIKQGQLHLVENQVSFRERYFGVGLEAVEARPSKGIKDREPLGVVQSKLLDEWVRQIEAPMYVERHPGKDVVSFQPGHAVQCDLEAMTDACGIDTTEYDGFPDSLGLEKLDQVNGGVMYYLQIS